MGKERKCRGTSRTKKEGGGGEGGVEGGELPQRGDQKKEESGREKNSIKV